MMELVAGSRVYYQASVMRESTTEIRVLFPGVPQVCRAGMPWDCGLLCCSCGATAEGRVLLPNATWLAVAAVLHGGAPTTVQRCMCRMEAALRLAAEVHTATCTCRAQLHSTLTNSPP